LHAHTNIAVNLEHFEILIL